MNDNPYQPVRCVVEDLIRESPTIATVRLKPDVPFPFQAGQFVMMTVPGVGEAPFTPSSSPSVRERLEVTVMRAGRVTARIHRLAPGDIVGIRGPYGKPYPLERFRDAHIFLVGGGVGLAPLRSLFLRLVETADAYQSITFCLGARTPQDIIYKDQVFRQWQQICEKVCLRITVDRKDDGWKYQEGVVTTTLDHIQVDAAHSVAVVCGPPVMMKFTTLKLLDIGFSPGNIYLSMERKMYCGVGQCRHCLIGTKCVCQDGPVFTFEELRDTRNPFI